MSGRKNYTINERNYLVSLVKEKINTVECPRTDGSSMAEKDRAWNDIAKEYNESNIIQFQRTAEQLKKLWKNIKQAQKHETQKERPARTINQDSDPNPIMPFLTNTPMFSSNLSSEKLANRQQLLNVASTEDNTDASPENDFDEEMMIPDRPNNNFKLESLGLSNTNLSQLGINGSSPNSTSDRFEASTSSSRKRHSAKTEDEVEKLKRKRLSNLIDQEKELHELKMRRESEIYDIRISHLREIMRLEEETIRAKLKAAKLDIIK